MARVLREVGIGTLLFDLLTGGLDIPVIELNRQAYELLATEKELSIVPGATHLFEEPGTLEEAARLAADWFVRHLSTETTTGK